MSDEVRNTTITKKVHSVNLLINIAYDTPYGGS